MNWKPGPSKHVAGIPTIPSWLTVYAINLLNQEFSEMCKIIHTKMSTVMINYMSSGEYNRIRHSEMRVILSWSVTKSSRIKSFKKWVTTVCNIRLYCIRMRFVSKVMCLIILFHLQMGIKSSFLRVKLPTCLSCQSHEFVGFYFHIIIPWHTHGTILRHRDTF
jgi:hypothetical protein